MLDDNFLLIVLAGFLLSLVLDFLTIRVGNKSYSTFFGTNAVFLSMFSATAIFSVYPSISSFTLLFFGLYRAINTGRMLFRRMHDKHLIRVSFKSFIYLSFAQIISFTLVLITEFYSPSLNQMLAVGIVGLALSWSLLNFWQALRWYRRSLPPSKLEALKGDLPTVSLLMPARNETPELEEAIQYALLSDYPKLEILILDDCSQDKTPEIIKEFAQHGVRFVQGHKPQKNWLAKNQAYNKLSDEASGEILLFTGVDTRLDPNAISYGVNYMLSNSFSMLSLMPKRQDGTFTNVFLQPLRYWLEFVAAKIIDNRPPVLSTCWFIEKKAFNELGKFDGLTRSIIPENNFAKRLSKNNQYAFLRSSGNFSITTEKKLSDQYDTAIRTRYPLLRKRPESAALASFLSLVLGLGPFALILIGFENLAVLQLLLLGVICTFMIASHAIVSYASNSSKWWVALFNFPVILLIEIGIVNISMYKYEFGYINWKGRNICLPVMHVMPGLPKID